MINTSTIYYNVNDWIITHKISRQPDVLYAKENRKQQQQIKHLHNILQGPWPQCLFKVMPPLKSSHIKSQTLVNGL